VSPLIPEDVHAGCVEEAERLRRENREVSATLVRKIADMRLDLAHTEALLIALEREQDAMICEAADELAASVQAAPMDAQHDHAHTLETERRLRARLDRIEKRLRENRLSDFPVCGSNDSANALHVVREERARAEGKPAEGGK
jgi:hypothetical protein